jgi:hypothetical protein
MRFNHWEPHFESIEVPLRLLLLPSRKTYRIQNTGGSYQRLVTISLTVTTNRHYSRIIAADLQPPIQSGTLELSNAHPIQAQGLLEGRCCDSSHGTGMLKLREPPPRPTSTLHPRLNLTAGRTTTMPPAYIPTMQPLLSSIHTSLSPYIPDS